MAYVSSVTVVTNIPSAGNDERVADPPDLQFDPRRGLKLVLIHQVSRSKESKPEQFFFLPFFSNYSSFQGKQSM